MNSVGIDLHGNRPPAALIDEYGEPALSKRIINGSETFLELLDAPVADRHRHGDRGDRAPEPI